MHALAGERVYVAGGTLSRHLWLQDIQIDFQSIAGLDRIKQELMEAVILPFSRPDLFPKNRQSTAAIRCLCLFAD